MKAQDIWSLVSRYSISVVSVVFAILVRRLLDPVLGDHFTFATLFVAVTFSASFGGYGPGLTALGLGSFAAMYFLIPPRGSFAVDGWEQQAGLMLSVAASAGLALLGGSMREAHRRAEANAQAEHAQREQLRITLKSIGDAVIVTDERGRVTLLNPAAQALTGWSEFEAVGQALEKVFSTSNEATGLAVESPVKQVLNAGTVVGLANHTVLTSRNGAKHPIEDSGAPIKDVKGAITGVVLVFRDVSERRRTEEAMTQSEARKTAILESALDAIITINHAGEILEFNLAAERTFGYRRDDVLGKQVADLIVPPALRELHHQGLAKHLAGDKGQLIGKRVELTAVRADGSEFPVELAITRISTDGSPIFTAYIRDLTGIRQTEGSLQRLGALVASSEDAITAITPEGIVTDWNSGAERIFGYSAADIRGKDVLRLVPPSDLAAAERTLERLREGEAVQPYEAMRLRKDGKAVNVSVRLSPIRNQNRLVGFSLIYRDLSGTKELEEQLRQAQKMEAIGQLAGGIAHDFNNLLTIISGYSQIVFNSLPTEDHNRELVQEIHKAGERAAMLTRQLLAFSRKQVLEPKVLNLNAIVQDTEKMLRRLIGEDVTLTAVLARDLAPVKVDPGQLEQVIINLAVNARDAMPQGGKLTLETANVELDEDYAQSHFEIRPGRYVMLAVSDTGCGIDEESKAHIFEPFYTTKGPGKGTGLGLSTVYGIVKQSGGSLYVYSEPGRGSTFKIYLPAIRERISTGKTQLGMKIALRGTETVLLVEDEPAVRSLSKLALQMYGYKVLEASLGEEALKISEQHSGPIHLLLTDVVMPQMSGRQVAEILLSRHPGMKVLYLSGYTDDAVVRHGVLEAETAFLQKPFTPAALAIKVRDVLDS